MNTTATTSAADAQREIAEEFAFFGDWTERYQYLIDLGKQLPPFPDEWKTEKHRVHGCQSMVWLVPSGDAASMHFALVLRVYSDRSAQEIVDTAPEFIGTIGLAKHLSPTRSNGLAAMLTQLKQYAALALK
jgi:cysteine desulfuration protein SufE